MQVLRMHAGHLIFNYLGISFENAPFDRLLGFRVSVRDVHWREIGGTPRHGETERPELDLMRAMERRLLIPSCSRGCGGCWDEDVNNSCLLT